MADARRASTYSERFNEMLMRSLQAGITEKLRRDVGWDVMRTQARNGRLLLQVRCTTGARFSLCRNASI